LLENDLGFNFADKLSIAPPHIYNTYKIKIMAIKNTKMPIF